MPKKKKYNFYVCRECEVDFYVGSRGIGSGHTSCPVCSDHLFVEHKDVMWLERPMNYKRKWIQEEDEILMTGIMQGRAYKEIAASLDRTPKACIRRASQLRKEGKYYEYMNALEGVK